MENEQYYYFSHIKNQQYKDTPKTVKLKVPYIQMCQNKKQNQKNQYKDRPRTISKKYTVPRTTRIKTDSELPV